MSDGGQLEVTVRNVFGRPTKVKLHADDEGYVVVNPPPPGGFMLHPTTDLPDFQEALRILGDVASKKRERGKP